MPTIKYDDYDVAGEEISSTYEGRHITLPESLLVHPEHTDGFVDAKDPVVIGNIVGVAFNDASAATDQIAIDTEGIWALQVVAEDADGNNAIAVGDELYINKTTAIITKDDNKAANVMFGYALMSAVAGTTDVIAIKVHFDPPEEQEMVGSSAVPSVLGDETIGREYRYSTLLTTGDVRSMYVQLNMLGAGTITADAFRPRVIVGEVAVAGAQGLHGSVGFSGDTLGRITGQASGIRGTYFANNRGQTGDVNGGLSELWAGGASTDFDTANFASIHKFNMGGNATGIGTCNNVFEFTNLSATQFVAATNTVIDHALRIVVDGTMYYIGLYDATA